MRTAEEILKENGIGLIESEAVKSEGFKSCIKAMKLYANEKLDEVSKKATIIGDFWGKECDECEYFDTEHGIRMTVNKKSILSLKDQI